MKLNVQVLVSIITLMAASFLFIFGIWHCYNHSFHYSASCDNTSCTFIHTDPTNVKTPSKFIVLKKQFDDVQVSRIDKDGEIIEDPELQKYADYNIKFKINLLIRNGLWVSSLGGWMGLDLTQIVHPQ